MNLRSTMTFFNFPIDVQINILSFLHPIELSSFACTCRRFAVLCSPTSPSADLWFALCARRWGSKTQLLQWSVAPSPRLYKTLERWEHLIGFWRQINICVAETSPLVLLEWSSSCIIGSHILPSPITSSYVVCKNPFFWLGLSASGETLSYGHLDNSPSDYYVIPVKINILGRTHLIVEENQNFYADSVMDESHDSIGLETGSHPDRVMSEIYQYFANRTIAGAETSSKRQRKKKERLRWETQYLTKIPDYFPTPTRTLQGLWKVIL